MHECPSLYPPDSRTWRHYMPVFLSALCRHGRVRMWTDFIPLPADCKTPIQQYDCTQDCLSPPSRKRRRVNAVQTATAKTAAAKLSTAPSRTPPQFSPMPFTCAAIRSAALSANVLHVELYKSLVAATRKPSRHARHSFKVKGHSPFKDSSKSSCAFSAALSAFRLRLSFPRNEGQHLDPACSSSSALTSGP